MNRLSVQARIWLLLMALTAVSVAMAEEVSTRLVAIVAIFLIAALKAELVIDHYMEARRAERHWLLLYMAWVAAVTVLLVWGHGWSGPQ